MADYIPMVAATKILKPLPARVGKVGDLQLNRTLPLVKSIVAATSGLVAFVATVGFLGFAAAAMCGLGFGALVVALSTVKPYKGENLFEVSMVKLTAKVKTNKQTMYKGQPTAMYLGIAPLRRLAAGKVHVHASAVSVDPDLYDERGVIRPTKFLD